MKQCPFCAEMIQAAAIKCRFCGEALDQTVQAKPQVNHGSLGTVALVIGCAGALMPYFAAVFLVPVAFICGAISYSRGDRTKGAIALVLACIGAVGIFYTSSQITDALAPLTGSSTSGRRAQPITIEKYQDLRIGMSYEQAVIALGYRGEEDSRMEIAGTTITTYTWKNPDFSSITATFDGNKLKNKIQYGLK